jgi:hypothetical protein
MVVTVDQHAKTIDPRALASSRLSDNKNAGANRENKFAFRASHLQATKFPVKLGRLVEICYGDSHPVESPGPKNRLQGRLVYTLTRMNPQEAETFGIKDADRATYVRLDSAKVNIAPPTQQTIWFKLVNVRLDNGDEEYPNGDDVQTVVPWSPPATWANLSGVALNAALTEIDAGLPNGQRYSGAASAKSRAAWPVVQRHCPDKTEPQCREIVRTWLNTGTLYNEDYDDPITRKTVEGLRVNAAKRPGSEIAP